MKYSKIFFLFSMIISISCKDIQTKEIIYSDNFENNIDSWVVEQMKDGTVKILDNKLDISQGNGAVIWFKEKLTVPITISYEVTIIDKGNKHDRIADMNCFWMANDPENPNDFFKNSEKRGGVFKEYFSHSLYYVGMGGHNNTKTRFRKYFGNGDRPLKPEHDLTDSKFLITPNKKNKIKIVVTKENTQFYCNDLLIYNIKEDTIYTSGYFGFRSYKNHQRIDNFKVTKP
ncbi:hypothetical protein OD91_0895 [Lutibacter sp. Hel_I_33_5]|uniref:DUF6250 domain-containing protein n=1 Tax=Lutibacter sp. Hel_I_33_5 TaxID=1566289 RepID=UPI0011A770C5|nr:DUF6250 domain-containing protein [Lutibacter sp. Hel_I_33_5]TVZ55638.1 hypothetical protein OD91_0895 [Lutibacter sp. Hel_I_33_5]